MTTERALFKVVGMYCSSCKPIVEKQLENEKGVKNIDIDYMTESVTIDFDPLLITKEEIKNKLEKSGYNFVRVARYLEDVSVRDTTPFNLMYLHGRCFGLDSFRQRS